MSEKNHNKTRRGLIGALGSALLAPAAWLKPSKKPGRVVVEPHDMSVARKNGGKA